MVFFWQRYSRIVFPLSKLGVVTAGTFVFLYSWNEFIYALLLTSSVKARTLQLGIRFFTSQFRYDYTSMFAAIVVTIIPSILVYIIFHEKIIQGLTSLEEVVRITARNEVDEQTQRTWDELKFLAEEEVM